MADTTNVLLCLVLSMQAFIIFALTGDKDITGTGWFGAICLSFCLYWFGLAMYWLFF